MFDTLYKAVREIREGMNAISTQSTNALALATGLIGHGDLDGNDAGLLPSPGPPGLAGALGLPGAMGPTMFLPPEDDEPLIWMPPGPYSLATIRNPFTNTPYVAGDYTSAAPSGGWTVDAGDVVTNRWCLIGNDLLFWQLELQTTTVASTPVILIIQMPNGFVSTAQVSYPIFISDNGASDFGLGQTVGTGFMRCLKKDLSAWANSTNNSYIRFSAAIPL